MAERVVEIRGVSLKKVLKPEIERCTYFIALDRSQRGQPDSPEDDYLKAEREVIQAHTFMVRPNSHEVVTE